MEQIITIFNCENDKFFILNTPSLKRVKEDPTNYELSYYELSTFVNIHCSPHIKQSSFIQNNKIIGIKKIKSIIIDANYMKEFRSTNNYANFKIDKIVLKYMHKYGINNVRGGSYENLNLSSLEYMFIIDELNKLYGVDNMTKQNNMLQLRDNSTNTVPMSDSVIQLRDNSTNTVPMSDSVVKVQVLDFVQKDDIPIKCELDSLIEDLNKMSYYDRTLNLTNEINLLNLNTIRLYSTLNIMSQSREQIRNKYPIIDQMSNIYNTILLRSNIVKYSDPVNDNLITIYLNLKAKLKQMKLELTELNSKYGSIENLQQIIDKELN
jgi:hypothetical protein